MLEKKYYIYVHRLPNGDPFYVGKGYGRRASEYKGRNKKWTALVLKHSSYIIEFPYSNLTEKAALTLERVVIEKYKAQYALCNMTTGGQGISGHIMSEESRRKMSVASKGNQRSLGRVLSEATKKKIGDAHRGKKRKPFTDETRRKMSLATTGRNNPMYGRDFSPEHRERLSIANLKRYGKL